jgi:redox-sensitive bicupin YhaK (pirin superfamily)
VADGRSRHRPLGDVPAARELFQIWLNLPGEDKLVPPHFAMLWGPQIPRHEFSDEAGRRTAVTTIAGELGERRGPRPPPRSWASRPDTDVAIWTLRLEPGASWTLPRARDARSLRTLYFFAGPSLRVGGELVSTHSALVVDASRDVSLVAGDGACEILMLQGRPIGEPQYGPFVMNDRAGIERAFADYRRTGFGGWPWPVDDPVHAREAGRFAKHADGRVENVDPSRSTRAERGPSTASGSSSTTRRSGYFRSRSS